MRRAVFIAIILVFGLYFAWLHAFARGFTEILGPSPIAFVSTALATMFIMVFTPLFCIPILVAAMAASGIAWLDGAPRRRWGRGDCGTCGYPRRVDSATCAECGGILVQPAPAKFPLRFALLSIMIGWCLGSLMGETVVSFDEWRFRREVQHLCVEGGAEWHTRPRAWPNRNCTLLYKSGRGFWAND
jgi:hypothetical protein